MEINEVEKKVEWGFYCSELLGRFSSCEVAVRELAKVYLDSAVEDNVKKWFGYSYKKSDVIMKMRYLASSLALMSSAVEELNELLRNEIK